MGEAMILCQDISKIYQVGDSEVRALDHASMHVDRGEFVSVIGPSGSGKSTLMSIIGCLDLATEGEYILDGQEIEDYSERELARIRRADPEPEDRFHLPGLQSAAETYSL